jgi:hypothetical protein
MRGRGWAHGRTATVLCVSRTAGSAGLGLSKKPTARSWNAFRAGIAMVAVCALFGIAAPMSFADVPTSESASVPTMLVSVPTSSGCQTTALRIGQAGAAIPSALNLCTHPAPVASEPPASILAMHPVDSSEPTPQQDSSNISAAEAAQQVAASQSKSSASPDTSSSEAAFGLSDAAMISYCPTAGNCVSDLSNLKSGLPLRYARDVIPYDTIDTYNPSDGQCQNISTSNDDHTDYPTQNVIYASLLFEWLKGAANAGLTPTIALSAGTYNNAGSNDNTAGTDPVYPDPIGDTTPALDYLCGISGLMSTIQMWSTTYGTPNVQQWESWNEPNDLVQDDSTPTYDESPQDAAYLWYWANYIAGNQNGGTVAAVTSKNVIGTDQEEYITNYFSELTTLGAPMPSVVAIHDYNDVDNAAARGDTGWIADIENLEQTLQAINANYDPAIWITEAGVWLDDTASYSSSKELYQEYDGNPTYEADGAQAFKYLAGLGNVTQVYWYELQTFDGNQNHPDAFDSALIGADNSGTSDGDPSGALLNRPQICVLAFDYAPSTAANTSVCNDGIYFASPCTGSQYAFEDGGAYKAASEPEGVEDINWEEQSPAFGNCETIVSAGKTYGFWDTTYTYSP